MQRTVLAVFISALAISAAAPALANQLAVGELSKVSGDLSVAINPPAVLNFKSADQILSMRAAAIRQCPNLIKGEYIPNQQIFAWMESNKPWWGMAGEAVFGPGQKSILGYADQSKFLLNPYLLVALESATIKMWNPDKITARDVDDPQFPYFWTPEKLEYRPREKFAQVVYDVSGYMRTVNGTGKLKAPTITDGFSVVAYNARDLGYQYICLDENKSRHISSATPFTEPIFIRQFIHCGGSCGYPGGCNNMSPFIPQLDRFRFIALPARLTFRLWREKPSGKDESADFTFQIDLI